MSRYYIVSTLLLILFIGSLSIDGWVHVPLVWYYGLIALYIILCISGSVVLSMQYFFPVHASKRGSDAIAITFNSGPIPHHTEKVLDILKVFNGVATFFCIGNRMQENPLLTKRIDDEGHLLGHLGYRHRKSFFLQSAPSIMKEFLETDAVFMRHIAKRPVFFRPPFGLSSPMLAKALKIRKAVVIGWSINSLDVRTKSAEQVFDRITQTLKAGDIILFHDHADVLPDVLPRLLTHVNKMGLKIVRVDELLNQKGYTK